MSCSPEYQTNREGIAWGTIQALTGPLLSTVQEQYRRSPRLTRVFRPADGFEFADSSATLVLTKLGKEIRLSPRKLSEIKLDEVEALMAAFSARLGACLLAGQHASDPSLLGFTTVLPLCALCKLSWYFNSPANV
jgi:hypothetical protein